MSIKLLFEPLELFLLSAFSDTFSYYPILNIYIYENNKIILDNWLSILYPNFVKNIENIKDLDKNYNIDFDIYQIFQKIVSKKIKINLSKFKKYKNDFKHNNYTAIILNHNLNKKDLDFLISLKINQKYKTKYIIFIGYHNDNYEKWIKEYNNNDFFYFADLNDTTIYDINKWLNFINIIEKSSFNISLGINTFSILQHLICENLNLEFIHNLENENYILEKSTNYVYSKYDYINDYKNYYKLNFSFLYSKINFNSFSDNNLNYFDKTKSIKKEVVENNNNNLNKKIINKDIITPGSNREQSDNRFPWLYERENVFIINQNSKDNNKNNKEINKKEDIKNNNNDNNNFEEENKIFIENSKKAEKSERLIYIEQI